MSAALRGQSRSAAAVSECRRRRRPLFSLRAACPVNVRSSLGGVDEEKGHVVGGLQADYVAASVFPGCTAPSMSGSLCPRAFLDVASKRRGILAAVRTSPFANFYFGAFGNNYVDRVDEKRYRHVRRLPRSRAQRDCRPQLRQVAGRVEPAAPSLPPRRNRRRLRHMGPAGGVHRGPGDEPRRGRPRQAATAGASWISDSRCSRRSIRPSRSVAVWPSPDRPRPPGREAMVSLKILW